VTTETELACIERDRQAGLAELGLQLDEVKQLAAALQAQIVPAAIAIGASGPRTMTRCCQQPDNPSRF